MVRIRFVETILPQSYLYELGIYLQTCAQIEYYSCSVICKMKGIAEGTPDWTKQHDELRNLATSDLITRLGSATRNLDDSNVWKKYFQDITGWLHQFVDNRHIAAHGRHYIADGQQGVTIDVAPRKSRTHRIISATPSEIQEAVKNADEILRSFIRYCEQT